MRGPFMVTVSQPGVRTNAANRMMGESLYSAHRLTIDQAIGAVCRRHRLLPEDAEDFASEARIHLMEKDFAALRRFEGRSSFSTYLLTVVSHFGQDWRNARWGKWRPSAEARRQGPIAAELERLMRRERFTFEEACETLRTNMRVIESRADLERMAATLPSRPRRRFVTDDHLEDRPAAGPTPYAVAERRAAAHAADAVVRLLFRAIASLPAEDILLLKLRFRDGLRIVDIADALCLEDKPLYRRLTRVLGQLKAELERQGLGAEMVRDLLASQGFADVEDRRSAARVEVARFPRDPAHLRRAVTRPGAPRSSRRVARPSAA